MSTKYIASNWRLPNQENSSKNDNYGLSFNGSNEYIDTGDAFTSLTSFSISAWFKSDDTATAAQAIVSSRINSIGSSQGLDIYLGSDTLVARIYNNGATEVTTSFTDTASWHHIVMTYNGTTLELFLDNVSQGTATGVYTNSAANWLIGKWNNGANYFNGSISECAFFDYALSSTQISTLYGSSSLGAGNPMALKPQPVAYYPLGDNSASNPLTQPNEAVEDASVFDFDGSSQHINLGNPEELQITGAITLSLWFNSTTSPGGFITKSDSGNYFGTPTNKVYEIGIFSNSLYWQISDGTTSDALSHSFSSYLDGNWHHLMATWDGTTNAASMKLFVDGSEVASHQATISAIQNKSNSVIISSQNYTYRYIGKMSNVAIWNSDQSSEISNIYNSGVPATSYTNTPTAWYKLDQSANWDVSGSGNWTIPDASGNGNDGTSSGMTSANLVLSDLTRAVPYDSYSFNFDSASSDYINCGTSSDLEITGNLTLSAWIYLQSGSAYQGIISKRDSGGTNYQLYTDNSATPKLRFFDGSTPASSTGTVSLNAWHHIAITVDSGVTNGSIFYIDGVNSGTATFTITSNDANLLLGAIDTGTVGSFLNGKLSNISLFNEALTPTEVLKLYANGVPQDLSSFSPAPVSWWTLGSNSFFNGSNYICRDLIGSSDGTSANAGVDAIVGDSPRSSANGVGTNNSIPENLTGSTKWSSNNSWSINMSSTARVEDTP